MLCLAKKKIKLLSLRGFRKLVERGVAEAPIKVFFFQELSFKRV
jgi:hypothetical protein